MNRFLLVQSQAKGVALARSGSWKEWPCPPLLRRYSYSIIFMILLMGFSPAMATAEEGAIQISREPIAAFSELDPAKLIGFRTVGSSGFLLWEDGNMREVDLNTGTEKEPRRQLVQPKAGYVQLILDIQDFTLLGQEPLVLRSNGEICGAVDRRWPTTPFVATRIDSYGKSALLSGSNEAFFLANGATMSVKIPGLLLGVPWRDGFLWGMRYDQTRNAWVVELLDMFGNKMKRVYEFSRNFNPSGVRIGPLNPEGELLISCWSGTKREFILLAQNGRMIWRLRAPEQVCERDVGWDEKGNLLVLEATEKGLTLFRWVFALPEG